MFDAIVKICDRLIKLVETRRLQDKQFFDSQVEPLFQHLLNVHEDYVAGVAEIVRLVETESADPRRVLKIAIEKRRRLQHIRQLVHDLTESLGSSRQARELGSEEKPTNYQEAAFDFAWNVSRYFYYSTGRIPPARPITYYSGLIGVINLFLGGSLSDKRYIADARDVQRALPEKWAGVTKSYARLLAFCQHTHNK